MTPQEVPMSDRLANIPTHFRKSLRTMGLAATMFALNVPVVRAQIPELPPSHSVVPVLYATGFEFAEGPAFNKKGDLFVVNYRGKGKIGRIERDGTASVFVDLNAKLPVEGKFSQANGLKVDRDGSLLAADSFAPRVLRIAADGSSVELLCDQCDGQPFRGVNDVCLDRAGHIYFSDPVGSGHDNPIGCIYRFDPATHLVTRLIEGLAFPNGLAVTPDQRHLCFAESQEYRVWIYDIVEGGLAHGRVLISFPRQDEGEFKGGQAEPDGMIFDQQGRLYVAMYGGGVVNVIDVDAGKLTRQFEAGGQNATNCHFFDRQLYVTTADKEAVFRLDLGVNGFDYNAAP